MCSTDRRYNLLTLAVQPGDPTVMRLLLAAGVEPNLPDRDGNTPLIHAVESGTVECARLLLEAGADSTRPGADGLTPRDVAQQRGSRTMIELLESVEK
jgi:ankyrin repeat protein